MGTVVLVGFSTAGKSTILRDFEKILSTLVEAFDSDKEISKDFGGHIYLLFSKLIKGKDRKNALRCIKQRENAILSWFQPSTKPRLIAFGPSVPSREEWNPFIERVRPIVFYLKLSECEVREGLRRRRKRHIKDGLQSIPAFGSWDQGVTTKFNKKSQSWDPIEEEKIVLKKIRKHMRGLTPKYKEAAGSDDNTYSSVKLRENEEYRQEFYEKVIAALLKP
jgi:shikimate kinase